MIPKNAHNDGVVRKVGLNQDDTVSDAELRAAEILSGSPTGKTAG